MAMKDQEDEAIAAFFSHSSARRVHTCSLIADVLRKQYPDYQLLIIQESNCDLFGYAQSNASCASLSDGQDDEASLAITSYIQPRNRTGQGEIREKVLLGKYAYTYQDDDRFVIYLVDGRDGTTSYPRDRLFFVLHPEKSAGQALLLDAGRWTSELHDEIWVFDGGFWQKSAELFDSVRDASWSNVILEERMKASLIEEHMSFFRSRDVFRRLHVPWKRGLLYYGPPGNGKTISIKATMNMLNRLAEPVQTLYVRTLSSYAGPEDSLAQIFNKARSMAPCYLVFEDLDSIVTDRVKSYFFNEVDGLKANDGIFMIGSTNYIDRLDPGISERPSRFDRKYLFPNPDERQREMYCHFWQEKLKSNKEIVFPDILCVKIAKITQLFSFAYMQEAFVATLLALAREAQMSTENDVEEWCLVSGSGDKAVIVAPAEEDDDDLKDNLLWKEIKKQIALLRKNLKPS